MMKREFKANDDADWEAMCRGIEYELLVRTVVRLAPCVLDSIVESSQEFLDAQPNEHKASVAEPVRFTTERLVNQILHQAIDATEAGSQIKQ